MWSFLHSTCFPALAEESSQTFCLDTARSEQLKLTPTADKFCYADKLTVRYLNSLFGTMCEHSESTIQIQQNTLNGCNEQTQFRPDELRCSLSDAGNDRIVERVGELQEHIENATLDGRRKTVDEGRQRRQAESVVGGMADGISSWLDENLNGTLWTPDEKGLARIAVDIPNRAARLKAIGNAQVPLCAAVAFVTLKEILDNYDC